MVSNLNDSTTPRVSVVVNVWGGDEPASLKRSLSSISSQRQRPDEVVVVVDGPISNDLEEEIQRFMNEATFPARTIYIQSPKGLWNARNVGIGQAKNEIIALHDADDVMHPERLSLQLKLIEESAVDVVASPVYEFEAKSEHLIGLRNLCDNSNLIRKMRWQNVINHSSVLLRRSAVLDVGGYRNVYLAEDYDLWIRMIQQNKRFTTSYQATQAFSVDSDLTIRRGGIKFIRSELAISKTISHGGEMNVLAITFRLIIRIIYRTSPRLVRKLHRNLFQVSKQQKFTSLSEFLTSKSI